VRKLLQLIFGDLRNVSGVAVALLAGFAISRVAPQASGVLLVLLLIGAAAAQAF
jgi:hypothetical protein